MKVSVIVPIYNTGEYLRACIQSVCDQTYRDLQIIMIDDGSEKYTADICDSIAQGDNRIHLIHKQNEGVSIARNLGLSLVSGDVVCFVDSDDTIHPDMIGSLVTALEENDAEIAMCDAVTITPGKPDAPDTIPDYETSTVISVKDIEPATLSRLAGSACRCAYRHTDTLVTSGAKFPEGIKFSEDRIFNLIAMSVAKKIAYLKQPYYNRLIREGSACFRYYPDITNQIAKMRAVLIPTVKKCWGDKYLAAYENQVAGHIRYAVTNFTAPSNGLSITESIAKLKELSSNSSVRGCLSSQPVKDKRSKLILSGNYLQLFIIGKLTNYYHKICRRGQYQA